MARQTFMDLVQDPQTANSTALVATTIEALWPAATYSPIPANTARVGTTYKITAFGTITFGTASTIIITPNVGTATGGATLGASATISCPVSLGPFPFYLEAMFVMRTIGSSGTMMGGGVFVTNGVLANTSPGANLVVPFGGTSAAFDTTAANGITIGKTLSVAGSVTPMAAVMQTLN
jgi:hypothetical protein